MPAVRRELKKCGDYFITLLIIDPNKLGAPVGNPSFQLRGHPAKHVSVSLLTAEVSRARCYFVMIRSDLSTAASAQQQQSQAEQVLARLSACCKKKACEWHGPCSANRGSAERGCSYLPSPAFPGP